MSPAEDDGALIITFPRVWTAAQRHAAARARRDDTGVLPSTSKPVAGRWRPSEEKMMAPSLLFDPAWLDLVLIARPRQRPAQPEPGSVTHQATRPAKEPRTFGNGDGIEIAPLRGHTRRVHSAGHERTAMHVKGARLAWAVAARAAWATVPATARELTFTRTRLTTT